MSSPSNGVRQRKTTNNANGSAEKRSAEEKKRAAAGWGRFSKAGIAHSIGSFGIMTLCPMLVIAIWQCIQQDGGSLLATFTRLVSGDIGVLPQCDWVVGKWVLGWILFQALLYRFLPGPKAFGNLTPAGHKLEYNVNGLRAWIVTHLAFYVGAYHLNLFSPAVIANNWGPILFWANVFGFALAFFSYLKAIVSPTHAHDCKFSGSWLYDVFFGAELNPRLFGIDFKLFFNGRPGIIAWTLINWSFAAAQYEQLGRVTNSMLIVNGLHFIYVIDFFWGEDWYLKTIDICHDHFGFYLAWGDLVWLPFLYPLQSAFLLKFPVDLSTTFATGVVALGLFGYFIFRSANHQKDYFRENMRLTGKCQIWGKQAAFVKAQYFTSDGKQHTSFLLAGGWWGLSNHMNYCGDLLLSTAMCLSCGVTHLLPFFYIIFMAILLTTRTWRDDTKCFEKYGASWTEYRKLVPWRLVPGIY